MVLLNSLRSFTWSPAWQCPPKFGETYGLIPNDKEACLGANLPLHSLGVVHLTTVALIALEDPQGAVVASCGVHVSDGD